MPRNGETASATSDSLVVSMSRFRAPLTEYFSILHEWSLQKSRPSGLTAAETANETTPSTDISPSRHA